MMDLKELQETDTWTLYKKCSDFMHKRNIYSDTDKNYRMYNGDQWYGLKVEGIEKIQHNFIKLIVKQKVSTITSNLFAINYSPENIENIEFLETAQKVCDLLNKKASKTWDKDFMDKKVKKSAKQAAINDEAVCYVTYEFDNDMPLNEIISKNDIMYGDENEEEIQLQPYILVRQRKSIIELQEMARKEQIDEKLIKDIATDTDTTTIAGDSGKEELDDKTWLITKFYRKDGTIHFSQATQYCDIKKDKDMGITLYPFAHFNWEDQEGNARGIGEVRQLIPNQLETNKTAMRRAITIKNIAYPQKIANIARIKNKAAINRVGALIEFDAPNGELKPNDVFSNTPIAHMSTDSEKFQSELITYSRDLNNASDATTGNVNPEIASGRAILAVQNAQNQPLNDQTIGLKTYIEDIARIWFEMWKTYAKNGLEIQTESQDQTTGELIPSIIQVPNFILEALSTSVKVDITPKGAFDKYAQELSLENLFTTGKITFEEYVEALDADSTMPKVKLENIVKKRQEAQKQIDALEEQAMQMKLQSQQGVANQMDIDNIANQGYQMINEATQM